MNGELERSRPGRPEAASLAFRRKRTVAILSEGFARDVFGVEELERRIQLAHEATTVGELDRLLDDIPEELHLLSGRGGGPSGGGTADGARSGQPPGQRRQASAGRSPSPLRDLTSGREPQEVRGLMTTRKLRGDWLRSRTVSVRTVMSTTELDFCDTAPFATDVEVSVFGVMSSLTVIVPPELAVEVDVDPILGEVREGRGVRAPSASGGPSLRIAGTLIMGEIRVRARPRR